QLAGELVLEVELRDVEHRGRAVGAREELGVRILGLFLGLLLALVAGVLLGLRGLGGLLGIGLVGGLGHVLAQPVGRHDLHAVVLGLVLGELLGGLVVELLLAAAVSEGLVRQLGRLLVALGLFRLL